VREPDHKTAQKPRQVQQTCNGCPPDRKRELVRMLPYHLALGETGKVRDDKFIDHQAALPTGQTH